MSLGGCWLAKVWCLGCLKPFNAPATIFISRIEKANPEKDSPQNLLSLISKNKLSVEEGEKLITQARATGLEVKGPCQPGSSKGLPKGFKEPEEGCNGNASRSWRRWLKKQDHSEPLYWAKIPFQFQDKKNDRR